MVDTEAKAKQKKNETKRSQQTATTGKVIKVSNFEGQLLNLQFRLTCLKNI